MASIHGMRMKKGGHHRSSGHPLPMMPEPQPHKVTQPSFPGQESNSTRDSRNTDRLSPQTIDNIQEHNALS